jgi:hypothetical protein
MNQSYKSPKHAAGVRPDVAGKGRTSNMGSDPNASRRKSLTTDELKRLWVEACRSWAANRDAEPAGIADVEAELDFRNESCPFI